MTNQTNSTENQEINLTHVSKKVKGYFSSVNDSIFDGILFIKRNIIAIAIILIAGAGYGFYLDTQKPSETKIFVSPNFGSTDYLYEEVQNLNSKIYNTEFKKATGINQSKKLLKLKIEPVIDIYSFIDNPAKETDDKDRNYQLFKLISENGDMTKVLKDPVTSKNYKYHTLTITTKGYVEEKDIKPVIDYLNSNAYYKAIQAEYVKNLDIKIASNDTILKQISDILTSAAKTPGAGANLVLNDNASIHEIIKQKEKLEREQARNRIDKINFKKIVNDSSMVLNGSDDNIVTGNMKYIVPFVLFLLFVAGARFKSYYKRQVEKRRA